LLCERAALTERRVFVKKFIWILVVVALMGLYAYDSMVKQRAYDRAVSNLFSNIEELEIHSAIADEIYRSTGRVEEAVAYWNAAVKEN
jgi:hypothetical protein